MIGLTESETVGLLGRLPVAVLCLASGRRPAPYACRRCRDIIMIPYPCYCHRMLFS